MGLVLMTIIVPMIKIMGYQIINPDGVGYNNDTCSIPMNKFMGYHIENPYGI